MIYRYREWYNAGALLLSNKFTSRLLLALYDLSDVKFDLYDETDLDEYWPTFQRYITDIYVTVCILVYIVCVCLVN